MERNFRSGINVICMVVIMMIGTSCKKDSHQPGNIPEPVPVMEYVDLNNTEIKSNAPGFTIDVNHDGRNDLAFTTQLVGDPLNQVDKLQFLISSNIAVNLPVNASEEIPVMSRGELIVPGNFNGYQWFELSSILLVQKIISFTQPPLWTGHWKLATNKYLPYQLLQDGKRYNGWVELSVDIPGERIVLHKAAICKEANKTVKAGE